MSAPTLTEFLLARTAEDEAAGRDALEGGRDTREPEPWLAVGWPASEHPGPVVLVDPARFLAECEAKRRIVGRHSETVECGNVGCQRRGLSGLHCLTCDDEWPCPDLRDLAAAYADHADYRPEWKP